MRIMNVLNMAYWLQTSIFEVEIPFWPLTDGLQRLQKFGYFALI